MKKIDMYVLIPLEYKIRNDIMNSIGGYFEAEFRKEQWRRIGNRLWMSYFDMYNHWKESNVGVNNVQDHLHYP